MRPSFITDEHLIFLDQLRESGVTNMFGAGRYLETSFGLDRSTAQNVLQYWMDTFGDSNR